MSFITFNFVYFNRFYKNLYQNGSGPFSCPLFMENVLSPLRRLSPYDVSEMFVENQVLKMDRNNFSFFCFLDIQVVIH